MIFQTFLTTGSNKPLPTFSPLIQAKFRRAFANLNLAQFNYFAKQINQKLKTQLKTDLNANQIIAIKNNPDHNLNGADAIVTYEHAGVLKLAHLELKFTKETLRNIGAQIH